MAKYRQPGDFGYVAPNDAFAGSQTIDQLIKGGYALTPEQLASLTPIQEMNHLYAVQGGSGFDPRFPGSNQQLGGDPNLIYEGPNLLVQLGRAGLIAGVGAGFGATAGALFNGIGAGASTATGTSAIPGLSGVSGGVGSGVFPLTTIAPSAIEASIFPLTTAGVGSGVGAGAGAVGSSLTFDNVKNAYDISSDINDVVSGFSERRPENTNPQMQQLLLSLGAPAGAYALSNMNSNQNTGGSNMANTGWGSTQGGSPNLPAPTTVGGGSGNFFTGSAPSATTNSRSLMTPEQDSTLSQLLAKLNAGNAISPYTGQLNAPQNSVQTGALQGMNGVMSNLDQNTAAYGGQLSAGNNNLQNISLTALEQMALGNASNNAANQSSVKALTDFTNAGPVDIDDYFNSSVQDPMLRDFQNKILPQLTQRFSGQAGFGSDRQRQEQLVTNDMMNTLANSRTNMAFGAQNQANANKMNAAMALPGVTSAGVNDMLNMQMGGGRQNAIDQGMLDNQYKDFIRQLSGNTQNANILGSLQSGGNIGQAAAQQPLTSQYQEFLRQQTGNQANIANTLGALSLHPFENISTVQGQQNGLLQGLLGGLSQPGGMQGGADLINSIFGNQGAVSSLGNLGSSAMNMFAPQMFNYSDMLGNGISNNVPDLFSTLGGSNTVSEIPDLFSMLF